MCSKEDLSYTDDGIEAILFTAQGDMRQALNNLQSTAQGFGHVSSENVFKVSLVHLFQEFTVTVVCRISDWENGQGILF